MAITRIQDKIILRAPKDKVWDAIISVKDHAQWHPLLAGIEGSHALGASRKCAIVNGKQQGFAEEVCTTFEEGRRILWTVQRDSTGFSGMVRDWSAGFTLEPLDPGQTRVTAESLFYPNSLPARLMLPLIKVKFHQVQKRIILGLKEFLENR